MLGFILLFLRSLLERVCFKFRHGCLLNYKYIIFFSNNSLFSGILGNEAFVIFLFESMITMGVTSVYFALVPPVPLLHLEASGLGVALSCLVLMR